MNVPHLPVLRLGRSYESLDKLDIKDHRSGEVRAYVSSINAGILRKDFRKLGDARKALAKFTVAQLIELAQARRVALPSFSEAGLRETVFKPTYANLPEYLAGFAWTCAVMQDAEALERIAYEFAWDNANEGVRYVEVRFAPQLHQHDELDGRGVLRAVNAGLARAAAEISAASP